MNTQTLANTVSTAVGEHLSGAPLTLRDTEIMSPSILRSEIDERITKIRPASTPIDQISRLAGSRHSGSMKVEYYSVDTKPSVCEVNNSHSPCQISTTGTFSVEVDKPNIFSVSDTVLFPNNKNVTDPFVGDILVGYVTNIVGNSLVLRPTQIPDHDILTIPEFNYGDKVVRMGRAACELDVQTPQYAAVPKKEYNFCQIFKAQIEESLYQRLSDKEVGWSFSDQEEVAIIDMRLGMEKSFLFGNRTRLQISPDSNDEVFLTGGIWHQAGQEFSYTPGNLDNNGMISLMRKAFTQGAGSTRKIMVAGSGLIEDLSKCDYPRTVSSGDTETIWGVNFNKIVSKFGTIYVAHSEIFDLCDMPECGMVIDPEYLTKYSHQPFTADRISFRKQGVRNTEAIVLTEASCLILRYPDAHLRITPKTV